MAGFPRIRLSEPAAATWSMARPTFSEVVSPYHAAGAEEDDPHGSKLSEAS